MFVGDTSAYGLYHLVYMALDAAVHQAGRGKCDRVSVELGRDGSCTLFESGRPPQLSHVPELLTGLNRPTDGDPLRFEWICTSALSSHFQLDGWDGRRQWRVCTRRGQLESKPVYLDQPEPVPFGARRGIRLRFTPDRTIFTEGHTYASSKICLRLRELAFVFPGLTTHLVDRRTGHTETRCHPSGLVGLVDELSESRGLPSQVIAVAHIWNEIAIRAAFRWTQSSAPPLIWSFANTVRTQGAGKHVTGLVRAMATALPTVSTEHPVLRLGPSNAFRSLPITLHSFGRGWVAAIAVDGPRSKVHFLGPTKSTLGIEGLDDAIAEGLAPKIAAALAEQADDEFRSRVDDMRAFEASALRTNGFG